MKNYVKYNDKDLIELFLDKIITEKILVKLLYLPTILI